METAKVVFNNMFSKGESNRNQDIFKFNWLFYIGSFAVLLCFPTEIPSLYTVLTGVLFGLITTASQYFVLLALRCGPMGITTFLQGSSLLIPTLFGIIFMNEQSSLLFWISLVLLLISMALVIETKLERINPRWLLFSFGSFLFMGGIGILQSVHQASDHRAELIPFLQIAFIVCALFNLFGWQIAKRKKEPDSFTFRSRTTVMAVGSGLAMGAVNVINLYLAGVMDKHIFFPIVNGGLIFLTLAAAVIFFKEKLTVKQWIGLILGIIQLAIIAL